jgi:REP element-mobilizing transposase RayT
VHLLVTIPPSLALSIFIGQVKGTSSHLAGQVGEEVFAWQGEYGVLSVSESHVSTVAQYILNQQQHHANRTLDERLERCDVENDSA